MDILINSNLLAVSLAINILVSLIKPFIKITSSTKRKAFYRILVFVLSVTGSYIYSKYVTSFNGVLVDACVLLVLSFAMYDSFGYKQIIEKLKGKLV